MGNLARRSIKSLRRDELVDAAIAVIGEEGLARATVANIATRAGMSPALVNHYFGGKEELLRLTMRSLSTMFRHEILSLLPPDPDPEQRLKAIIDGSFVPQHFRPGAQEAWLQFWMHALHEESFTRLHRIISARFWSNIRYAVRRLVPEPQVQDAVDGLSALIDGFSWRFAVDRQNADFERARRICWDYVQHSIMRRR
jgi:TetR/AcrR family transcriptional repressor of bet genes